MSNAKTRAIANVKWCQQVLTDLCKDIPQDKLASGIDNHAVWTIGHLAHSADFFATLLSSEIKASCPESYKALFGMGSQPTQDASKYPSMTELQSAMDRSLAGFIRAAEMNSEADLDKAPLVESGEFCKTRWEVLDRMSWHTGWHSGQVSLQRKLLGVKPMWG